METIIRGHCVPFAAQANMSVHVVIATDKGIDVLCWLATTLFECTVGLSVNEETKMAARGQGPSVTIAALRQVGAGTYSYANAHPGTPGKERKKEDKQWNILEMC